MTVVMLGIDLSKNVCSVAGLDETGAVVLRRPMKRDGVMDFGIPPVRAVLFAKRQGAENSAYGQPYAQSR